MQVGVGGGVEEEGRGLSMTMRRGVKWVRRSEEGSESDWAMVESGRADVAMTTKDGEGV